jgi:hypothetical protein
MIALGVERLAHTNRRVNRTASGTSRSIGGTTFHDFNNDVFGRSRSIGGWTFHAFDSRASYTCRTIGSTRRLPNQASREEFHAKAQF